MVRGINAVRERNEKRPFVGERSCALQDGAELQDGESLLDDDELPRDEFPRDFVLSKMGSH